MKTLKQSKGNMTLVIAPALFFLALLTLISSCSPSKQLSKKADSMLLQDSAISSGHIGISIYEPATGKYWYNHNAEQYFIPASNTKLFSLYAGLKFLGDSLVGLRYYKQNDTLYALATGDPTFLHPDFLQQPVADFLLADTIPVKFCSSGQWRDEKFGPGWAWDDYNSEDMTEKSPLPVYGNLMKIGFRSSKISATMSSSDSVTVRSIDLYYPKTIRFTRELKVNDNLKHVSITRQTDANHLEIAFPDKTISAEESIPFITNGMRTALQILRGSYQVVDTGVAGYNIPPSACTVIHSRPSDSLFIPMMKRSDNFFAEQTLLMASNEHLGYMSGRTLIDSLLRNELKDVPQKPKWVDGSGLSRYNLFTPQSFVYILKKMSDEFGLDRLKTILATGGQGTLRNYYKSDSSYIFAKTGTLSNNCALSGFLITNSGKTLIFSILANNYMTGAGPVRRATERFLADLRKNY